MKRTNSLVFALVLLGIAGCTAFVSPRRLNSGGGPRTQGGGGTQANNGGGGGAAGDPLQVLNGADAYLRQRGYTANGPAVRNTNMQRGQLIAYALDVQPGRCYVALAIGAQGADLDMVILNPYGATVAHDVAPDGHPSVAFCPRNAGRHVARVQMSQGQGAYYYIAYSGPAGSSPQLAGYFGDSTPAQQTQTQAQTASLDSGTQGRVSQVDGSLRGERFTRVAEPYGIVMGQRQDRNFPLNLSAGYCYAFGTFAGNGANDTDVFIVDGAGAEIVQDIGTERDALVRFCPPTDGSYQLRARLYDGSGPVFVAGWSQPRAGSSGTTNVPPPATDTISRDSTAGAGLDENFRLLNADMQARGYEAFGESTPGQLTEGQTRDFSVNLEGGKCYAILAVGDAGVRNLDLIVQNGSRVVDRDVETDARPVVRVCPEASGNQTIRVSMTSGQGNFVYAAYKWSRGTRGPFGLAGVMYVRLGEVTSLLNVENFQPSEELMPEQGRLASQGRDATHRLQLSANKCYAIVVVGGDGVNDLGVSLTRGGTVVAADTSHSAFPNVRVCTQSAETYSMQITAENGSGRYYYQVFQRTGQ
jgi:hypothetical protein